MLKSQLLSPNGRLQQAGSGPPSIRRRPPDDDNDAVQRIQKALVQCGQKLPKSFKNGPNADPDGLYGSETETAVRQFQKEAFPGQMSQWDGRCGPNTLGALDARLGAAFKPQRIICSLPGRGSDSSNCTHKAEPKGRNRPGPVPIPYPTIGTTPRRPAAASKPVPRYNFSNAWPKK